MKRVKIKDVTLIALFAAVITILSQLALPSPVSGVPLTLQTFAIMLAGFCLPFVRAVSTVATYIALGAVGMPVFSGLQGGFGVLAGPTGGFLWGFVFLAALCSFSMRFKHTAVRACIAFAGILVCHALGAVQYSAVTSTTVWHSLLAVSLPYIFKDMASGIAAYWVLLRVKRYGGKENEN